MAQNAYSIPKEPRELDSRDAPGPLRTWSDLWRWVKDVTEWMNRLLTALRSSITTDGDIVLLARAVADLGTPSRAGLLRYASDGRKNGEGAGLGTGVLVFSDSTLVWKACDTGQTVAA